MRTASCSCGQLTVSCDGDPVRISVCHCLACQKRTGSAFGYQARFPRERVEINGESRTYVRFSDEDGEQRSLSFCPECGATVYYTTGADTDLIAVAGGAFLPRRVSRVAAVFSGGPLDELPAARASLSDGERHLLSAIPADLLAGR